MRDPRTQVNGSFAYLSALWPRPVEWKLLASNVGPEFDGTATKSGAMFGPVRPDSTVPKCVQQFETAEQFSRPRSQVSLDADCEEHINICLYRLDIIAASLFLLSFWQVSEMRFFCLSL